MSQSLNNYVKPDNAVSIQILQIDDYVYGLHSRLEKYISLENMYFNMVSRYPLSVDEKRKANSVLKKPFHPFLGLPILLQAIHDDVIVSSSVGKLYYSNPATDETEIMKYGSIETFNVYDMLESYLSNMILIRPITHNEIIDISNYIERAAEQIYEQVACVIANVPTHIINFDVYFQHIVMISYGDANKLRLKEATNILEQRKLEKTRKENEHNTIGTNHGKKSCNHTRIPKHLKKYITT